MKSLFKFWIKGWCIIGRLWVFCMMAWLLTLPFNLFAERVRRISTAEDVAPENILFFALFIITIPFIFSIAGKATGEFMIPKKTINEIITRDAIRRGMNSVLEKK